MIQVLQKGYTLGDRVLRPARVVISAGERWLRRLYESARRREERVARRAQEGVPQARPRGAPRPESRQRGALQGGAVGVRRALRPGEAQAVRRDRVDERPRRRRPGRHDVRLRRLRPRRHLRRALQPRPRGQPQPQRGQRGNDVEVEVRVSFEDALRGAEVTVPVQLELACHTCHGTGAAPGTAPVALPAVQGHRRRRDVTGPVRAAAAVPALPRDGLDRRDAVPDVPRRRSRAADEALQGARSPPASKDGTRIKLKGKGEAGYGGAPAGDLFVTVRVEPSKIYERRGDDLIVQVPVSFATAALGGTVEVPTPDGPVSLKVPAGTEDGKLLRIKGRGAPRAQGHGPRRRARADQDRGAEEGLEEAARAARAAAAGGRDDRRGSPSLHDQRRGRARRDASADAAHLRAARPRAPAAHGRQHAALLRRRRRAACA